MKSFLTLPFILIGFIILALFSGWSDEVESELL